MGSGFKNGMTGVASHRPVCQAAFMLASWPLSGVGVGMQGAYCWLGCLSLVGVSHIPSVPSGLV